MTEQDLVQIKDMGSNTKSKFTPALQIVSDLRRTLYNESKHLDHMDERSKGMGYENYRHLQEMTN
ncbi:MAG: hypothetical protein M3P33_00615 [bacterium]|nr:hypothetical protein [bacterium]